MRCEIPDWKGMCARGMPGPKLRLRSHARGGRFRSKQVFAEVGCARFIRGWEKARETGSEVGVVLAFAGMATKLEHSSEESAFSRLEASPMCVLLSGMMVVGAGASDGISERNEKSTAACRASIMIVLVG
jgi:hypothetical protein